MTGRGRGKRWALWAAMGLALPVWVGLWFRLPQPPDPLWPAHAPGMALRTVLFFPFLEEWIFRGRLQPWLAQSFSGQWYGLGAANVLTSLLFAALHGFTHPPAAAAAVFLPSLVFGWVRDRTGSFLPAFVVHAWYNLGYFWLTSGMR